MAASRWPSLPGAELQGLPLTQERQELRTVERLPRLPALDWLRAMAADSPGAAPQRPVGLPVQSAERPSRQAMKPALSPAQ